MIIWLASYPKSGNTCLRSIIASLLYSDTGIFSFDLIDKIKQFPDKKYLKDFTGDFDNIHEVKKYWLLAQEKINLDGETKFFKTHNINCKIGNYSFTNKENTLATIYVVRDPRNLISSISNHYSKNYEEAKNFLMSPKIIGGSKDQATKGNNITTLLGSWADHYNFWTRKTENLLLIKYEDLLTNTEIELHKIINFLNNYTSVKINETKIENIIKSTSFENLKKMEKGGLFKEGAINNKINKKVNFFHKGPKNLWQNNLDENIRKELENCFSKEMNELGYL